MTTLITKSAKWESVETKLRSEETQALLKRLESWSVGHAASVYEGALLMKILGERAAETQDTKLAERLRQFNKAFNGWLPAVSEGRIIPEALIALFGKNEVLEGFSNLLPAEQSRLLEVGSIPVRGKGSTVRVVPLDELTKTDINRAIDKKRLRVLEPNEQEPVESTKKKQLMKKLPSLGVSEDEFVTMANKARSSKKKLATYMYEILKEHGCFSEA